MATMTDEEYQMYQKYGPNYREYMRFGYGRNQARARNQFNPGGGFYHTDPPQVKKVVENIMGTPAPEQGSPYLSDYLEEYEKTRQRVLQLEDLMNQNQFQYSQPDMSFEDFYNQYYGNYGGGGGGGDGGDEGNNGVTEVAAQISQTPQFEGNVPVPGMPGWAVWNGANTMAIVNWLNPKTGERFTAPHGGFSPPSGEGWVTEESKPKPLDPKDKRPDATTMSNAGVAPASVYNMVRPSLPSAPTYAGVQSSQALTGQAANNAQMAQSQAREQASPAYVAPVQNMVRPTLDSYIQRYERDESSPVVAPVQNMVRPSLPTAKKSVTPVKVWGNRNN